MDEKTLTSITDSIQNKIGKEASGIIADDLANLMTQNTQVRNLSANKDEEIKKLKENNEKLVIANGNLLKQIDMGDDYSSKPDPKKEEKATSFNFRDAFDEHGRFKK